VSGTPGITVSVGATDRVILDGLDFEGIGMGTNGVSMVGAGFLIIRNSSIRDFTGFGVNMAGTSATPAPRLLIQNSLITGNASGGINVQGASGATNNAEVLNTLIDSNTTFGIQVIGPSTLVLSASTVTGQPSNIIVSGGGSVVSYGNNLLRNAGAPTSTLPLQ
jgi:Right handed beta helix region